MGKKCIPGIICLENMTIILIIIIIFVIFYIIYKTSSNEKIIIKQEQHTSYPQNNGGIYSGFGYFSKPNLPKDVLLNPYTPPLNDERFLIPEMHFYPPNTVPINISTNMGVVDTPYRQVGLLNPINKNNKNNDNNNIKILSLMGRPLYTNRNKWQYYTMSDQFNSVKLPIIKHGKSGTSENGCDQIYSGDIIYVEGYNEPFKTKIYDNDTIKYIPYI